MEVRLQEINTEGVAQIIYEHFIILLTVPASHHSNNGVHWQEL
jgi:hypothetical protein